jgi:hypothetical protein
MISPWRLSLPNADTVEISPGMIRVPSRSAGEPHAGEREGD